MAPIHLDLKNAPPKSVPSTPLNGTEVSTVWKLANCARTVLFTPVSPAITQNCRRDRVTITDLQALVAGL